MARIVIVGSGVVGQATGKGFAKKGHSISYVDINPQTIERLRAVGLWAMTASEVDWDTIDVVMLAVSTPSVDGRIVLDYIESAALDVGRGLAKTSRYIIVVVRSTVPPTTTEPLLSPIRTSTDSRPGGVRSRANRRRKASAARTARRAWSSCAVGTPMSAMKPSPMKRSMVPS